MKRALLSLLGLLAITVVAAMAWIVLTATPRGGVAVIGDAAPALLERTGLQQTLPVHTAALTVVSVDSWSKLPFIADMHALCGAECLPPVGIVRVLRLRPMGSDRLLLLEHAALGGLDCTVETLRSELASEPLPDCAEGVEVRSLWSVPGLGTF